MDAGNMLKPMLARGELRMVGATTLDEYRERIEKDPALERRFQQVFVGEPSVEDTIAILRGLKGRYEAHHEVQISDAALGAAAALSERHITGRFRPDRAIDLADQAASRLMYGEIPALERELAEALAAPGADAVAGDDAPMVKDEVGPDDVADVVSSWTGIPAGRLLEGETGKLLRMEAELGKRLVG